ncbi:DNA replication complex GINS protein PSF1-like isoform X2 [Hyalella azteca]|uniref:DNA replication complex GINS protein PSF1 n=1 Tax=Hyalella azteca TaxID=294128 RepID=A0A8B7NRE4_HYAAZ|nr:DNA replication complex GINS protein PSF1-like isoform X1 [Hyalella azteca]XP_018016283.1 DNA replication complex GINS protein PSF1-like isoform X2 [Hyalella azteca]
MLGDKAFSLIQELDRSQHGTLPPFNEDAVRQALEEIDSLFQQNVADINHLAEDDALVAGIHLRHAALERNKRCLLAYLYNRLERLRTMRWQLGSVLPSDVRTNLCEPELEWFAQYSSTVARYMRSLGDGQGLDLTVDLKPPKNLYIEVRCLQDYGEFELEEGEVVLLSKDSTHFLPMEHCQHLIRQGVLQHVK